MERCLKFLFHTSVISIYNLIAPVIPNTQKMKYTQDIIYFHTGFNMKWPLTPERLGRLDSWSLSRSLTTSMSINVNHWDRGVCHVSVNLVDVCITYSIHSQFHSYSHSCNLGEREQAPTLMMSMALCQSVWPRTSFCACAKSRDLNCHGASVETEWCSNGEPERDRR